MLQNRTQVSCARRRQPVLAIFMLPCVSARSHTDGGQKPADRGVIAKAFPTGTRTNTKYEGQAQLARSAGLPRLSGVAPPLAVHVSRRGGSRRRRFIGWNFARTPTWETSR